MNPVNSEWQDDARKWLWYFLAALLASQLYFVRELLAALFLFALGFGVLAGLALFLLLIKRACQFSMPGLDRTHAVWRRLRAAGSARLGKSVESQR